MFSVFADWIGSTFCLQSFTLFLSSHFYAIEHSDPMCQTGLPVHASSNMLFVSHVDAHTAHTQITEGETKVWAKAKKDREKEKEKRERETPLNSKMFSWMLVQLQIGP